MTTTDDSSTAHKSRAGTYVAYVLIALVLYVLSMGPAAWLNGEGYLSWDSLDIAYYPICCLPDVSFLREPIIWYLELWAPMGPFDWAPFY